MTPQLALPANTIDLWICYPNPLRHHPLLTHYRSLLSADEAAKCARYRFERDRHTSLITRALIRDTLSKYEKVTPDSWQFDKGEKDKPHIHAPESDLLFNLSHTDGLVICGITRGVDIGVDVEDTQRDNAVLEIADRFFSAKEIAHLQSLPKHRQTDRFFDFWTLKESFIKAVGLGLAIPLGDFSFHIQPHENPKWNPNILLETSESLNEPAPHFKSWLFYPSMQYRVALSVRGATDIQSETFRLRCFETVPCDHFREVTAEWMGA